MGPVRVRGEEELDAVAELVAGAETVATGGVLLHRKPSALVRALVRRRPDVEPFTLVTLAGSYDVGLLVEAGLLAGVAASYVGFGPLGLAPAFTRLASDGVVAWTPHSEATLSAALRAAAAGMPGLPVPWVEGTDLARRARRGLVPALAPDVALLHFPFIDDRARVLLPDAAGLDLELLRASRRLAVTVDRVVPRLPEGGLVVPLPPHAEVWQVPYGAHPTSSHPHHAFDAPHLVQWMLAAGRGDTRSYHALLARGEARWRDACVRPQELLPLAARLPVGPPARVGPRVRPPGALPAETMAWAMAQLIPAGASVALGLATLLPYVAYLWGREAASLSPPAIPGPPGPLLAGEEGLWTEPPLPAAWTMRERAFVARGASPLSFATLALEELPAVRPVEFLRPAQVDPRGRTNNLLVPAREDGALGGARAAKTVLPGPAGIPDVTAYNARLVLYVPRHRPGVFVSRLAAVSGKGVERGGRRTARRSARAGPLAVVTDLCVMGFGEGRLRLSSLHPGVRLSDVVAATGFEVVPRAWRSLPESRLPRTPQPPPEALELLRRRVDPLGLREVELMGSSDRAARLLEIVVEERRMFHPVAELVGA